MSNVPSEANCQYLLCIAEVPALRYLRSVFDAAFVLALVWVTVRTVRARVFWAAVLSLACLASLLAQSMIALASRSFEGGLFGIAGVVFLGPTAVPFGETSLVAWLACAIAASLFWIACCLVGLLLCRQRSKDLRPDTDLAQSYHRAEVSFVGAGTFASLRLVTLLLLLSQPKF